MKNLFWLLLLITVNSQADMLGAFGPVNPANIVSQDAGYVPYATVTDGRKAAVVAAIAAKRAEWAATPYLVGNNQKYFCDCTGTGQTCTAAGSVEGNDTTGDGSVGNPWKTLAKAITFMGTGTAKSALLCQGGSFAGNNFFLYDTTCTAGTICNEIREYPQGGTNAKPIIYNNTSATSIFQTHANGISGYRILNLHLKGTTTSSASRALFTSGGTHDLKVGGVDFDTFGTTFYIADGPPLIANNIEFTGNTFTTISNNGTLGASNNFLVGYNEFIDAGSDNAFDHPIYVGSHFFVTGVTIVGNYAHGFYHNGTNTKCDGLMLRGGGEMTNVTVAGNYMEQAAGEDGNGCLGLAWGSGGYTDSAGYCHNCKFSGNTFVNSGLSGLSLNTCSSGCEVFNNVISKDDTTGSYFTGIDVPSSGARIGALPACTQNLTYGPICTDEPTTGVKIYNNTTYLGTGNVAGVKGIQMQTEGTGYVVTNNTVTYAAASAAYPTVFLVNGSNTTDRVPLPLSAFLFVDNNHMYAPNITPSWYATYGSSAISLAAWNSLSGRDLNSLNGVNPLFTDPTTLDFSIPSNSPLKHTGNNLYFAPNDITGASSDRLKSVGANK